MKLKKTAPLLGLAAALLLSPATAFAQKNESSVKLEKMWEQQGREAEKRDAALPYAESPENGISPQAGVVVEFPSFGNGMPICGLKNGMYSAARGAVIQKASGMRHYGTEQFTAEYEYGAGSGVKTQSYPVYNFDTTTTVNIGDTDVFHFAPTAADLKGKGYPTSTELLAGEVTGPTTFHVMADANPFSLQGRYRWKHVVNYKGTGTPGTSTGYMSGSRIDENGWGSVTVIDGITAGYIRCDTSAANTPVTKDTMQVSCEAAINATPTRNVPVYNMIDAVKCNAADEAGTTDSTAYGSSGTLGDKGLDYVDYTYVDYGVDKAGQYVHGTWYTQAGNNVTNTIRIPDAVQILYDTQGGSAVAPSSKTFTGFDHTVTSDVPTKAGYQFLGWYTAATGGSKVEAGTKRNLTSNLTLYAQWKANHKITTSKEGEGTITGTITGITPGESKTVTYKAADGWFVESVAKDGSPVTVADGATEGGITFPDIHGDHTVHVKFYKGFTIKTSIDGGTISPDKGPLKKGADETVTFAPDKGSYIKSVTVDGTPLAGDTLKKAIQDGAYAFTGIQADHEIHVSCVPYPKLTVTKRLDETKGYIPEKGSPEFSFKVSGTDCLGEARTFYLHLSVGHGTSATGALTVPAGAWKVSELKSDNWKLTGIDPSGDGTGAAISTMDGDASVVFLNTPDDYSRFTHNDAAANDLTK